MVREIVSDAAAMRTVLAFIASLRAGGPAMVFGYLPTAGKLADGDSEPALAQSALNLVFLIRNNLRIEAFDVTPGFHYYESEGTAPNMYGNTGTAHARIMQW
eukprot:723524-Pyramimonas_sp.AAC.1